jgi:hypothetical protein
VHQKNTILLLTRSEQRIKQLYRIQRRALLACLDGSPNESLPTRLPFYGRDEIGGPRPQHARRPLQDGAALVGRGRTAAEGGVGGGDHAGHLGIRGGVNGGKGTKPILSSTVMVSPSPAVQQPSIGRG